MTSKIYRKIVLKILWTGNIIKNSFGIFLYFQGFPLKAFFAITLETSLAVPLQIVSKIASKISSTILKIALGVSISIIFGIFC